MNDCGLHDRAIASIAFTPFMLFMFHDSFSTVYNIADSATFVISSAQGEDKTTMRTGELSTVSPIETANTAVKTTHQGSYAWLRSPLWFCLLLALGLRIWLVIRTQGFIDGDEAVVGIQAQHILRGELPVYYYGQPYMGSLEAYFIALIFALVGPSTWAMRAEPILLSLALVWLSWRLAGALAAAAKLSASARRLFMTIAALFAALPPLYDAVMETRTWAAISRHT